MKKGIEKHNIRVLMECDNLGGVSELPVPFSCSVEYYRRGHEKLWVEIHRRADKYNEINEGLFFNQFGNNENFLSVRQFYLFDQSGWPLGTASAWFDPDYRGQNWGRIHWIAIVSEAQGQGLSKVLLSIACRRLLELGHRNAYLTTSTARIPAINLYLKFGFRPVISCENDFMIWNSIRHKLKYQLAIDS